MVFDVALLIKLILICLTIDIMLFLGLVIRRYEISFISKKNDKLKKVLLNVFLNKSISKIRSKDIDLFVNQYAELMLNVSINKEEKELIKSAVDNSNVIKFSGKLLNSFSTKRRIKSAVMLGFIGQVESIKLLEEKLIKEKNYIVKLYIINSLIIQESHGSDKFIYESLIESPVWYQKRFRKLIMEYKEYFYQSLDCVIERKEIEIKKAIIYIASIYYDIRLKEFMLKEIDSYLIEKSYKTSPKKRKHLYFTLECLAVHYHKCLDHERYLDSDDLNIREIAIKSLEKYGGIYSFNKVMAHVKDKELIDVVKSSLLSLLEHDESLTRYVSQLFVEEQNRQYLDVYAYVLSYKIEYFARRLLSSERKKMRKIIEKIIFHNYNMSIIDYLNKNNNLEIENEIIDLLNDVFEIDGSITKDYTIYLDADIMRKMNLRSEGFFISPYNMESLSLYKKIFIATLFTITVLLMPIIYFLININDVTSLTRTEIFREIIRDIPIYLGFYYVILNSIYILMCVLSIKSSADQKYMGKLKKKVKVFERALLPSISIIIPISNQKKYLVDGLNGYLNIKYPKYDIILIDDGSTDESFELLSDYFGFYKENFNIEKLEYYPSIRSVYRSRRNSNLVYVDKKRTGKSDCLDLGSILSEHEYVCAADIDGVMDQDFLYKMASRINDDEEETIAVLGNVVPINDCEKIKGCIDHYNLPHKLIAKLQYIDLFRNYINIKIARGYMNSILMPSGSFCLFKRDKLMDVGGYKGYEFEFKDDTNKEDIDLMYRLIKHMYDNLLPYKISYNSYGNYYRVLPENILSLRKLRRRWQREYLDAMITHSDMLLNANYGLNGEFNSILNLILEFVAPLFEIIGLSVFIFTAVNGTLSLDVMIFVIFGITLGTISSVLPVCMLNTESEKSSIGAVFELFILSIVSTFGYLQIVRALKISDTIGAIKKHDGYYQKRFAFKSNRGYNRQKSKEREKIRTRSLAYKKASRQIRASIALINNKN
ncbi:MAG: glycosyltransferase [Acidaminobacteraceae bacterium]